jgi:hypothetical protein
VLTTLSNVVALQPERPSFVPSRVPAESSLTREAGMSSDASICFTPRRAVGRMDAGAGLHPHGEYVASLVIDLAMASSTGAANC